MERSPSSAGGGPRVTVFLPCHSLDDFPSWLDEAEADDVLAAWTSGWHPALVASSGGPPRWSSVDLPPPHDGPLLGIVPAAFDDRFASQFDGAGDPASRWVRGVRGAAATAAAACAAAGRPADGIPARDWADDFAALGLAVLLTELLARRMRSAADLETTGFAAAVVAAARAAMGGDDAGCREGLRECFGWLEGVRDRFYAVDAWLLDLVLVADSTLDAVADELAASVPMGLIVPARLVPRLAATHPDAVAAVRRRVAEGSLSCCSGRLDEGPLDGLAPEEILAALEAGRQAWTDHVGCPPTVFAERGGCSSGMLPAVLAGLGFAGAVWSRFDGGPLPDPRAGRIRWEGNGGGSIEAVARPPADARTAAAVLALPERLGDAMDHDHVAVVSFAHHAGTASRWHGLLRRASRWTTAFGSFVTPDELFRRTAGTGTPISFAADAFPRPPGGDDEPTDPLGASVAATRAAADRIVAAAAVAADLLAPMNRPIASPAAAPAARRQRGWWPRRVPADDLALDDGLVRLAVHPVTGGILSLRRPDDPGNRVSQQLAWRAAGHLGSTRADAIERGPTACGAPGIVSRGRLLDAVGAEVGRFVQGMSLVPGLPIAVIDIALELDAPPRGRPFEDHVACRFAWHENEDVEIRRGIHLQAVPTSRERFAAPYFIEVADAAVARGRSAAPLAILCGGLPWHFLSSPHVLDTLLVAGAVGAATRRLAVGIGVERPWDAALDLAAAAPLRAVAIPRNVRLEIAREPAAADGGPRAVVGVIESAGRSGEVRIEWAADVVAARACDLQGRPRDGVDIAIDGRATVVFLRPYEWLRLALEFRR